MRPKKIPWPQGFTLIELMVAVAVLAILASVAVPSFVETIQSNRLTTQANDALGLLLLARSEAVKQGEDVVVTFEAEGTGWRAIVGDSNDPIRVVSRPDSPVSVDVSAITFNGLGRTAAGTLSFTYGNFARHICILASGQSRVVKTEGECQ